MKSYTQRIQEEIAKKNYWNTPRDAVPPEQGFDPTYLDADMHYTGRVKTVMDVPEAPQVNEVVYVTEEEKPFVFVNRVGWLAMRLDQDPPSLIPTLDGGVSFRGGEKRYVVTGEKLNFKNRLTYRGISCTLHLPVNLTELFFAPHNLTREDMGMFKMTYPEEFRSFREKWAEKWAIERAKEEFDEWEEDPYEKNRQRNYARGIR